MKHIFNLILLSLLLISCSTQTSQNKSTKDTTAETHTLENEEQDYHGSTIWVGEITEENFQKEPYNKWYNENYDMFTVDQQIVNQFKDELFNYDITIFMGTWCGDSKALTPEFLKVLKVANYPDEKISMYAVDRSKESLNGEEEGLNITHVPTFIFYKNGKEVNRIVESTINTLEEDIRDIVLGKDYTPNYSE